MLFNTVFIIQELASVDMKRILTSRAAVERADAAALVRERSIHPWRHLDSSANRRHTISNRTDLGGSRTRLSLADLSAPASPGQAYARAAATAAACEINQPAMSSPSTASPGAAKPMSSNFNPPATSTPVPGGLPTPSFKVPLPILQRTKNQSTVDAAAAWHARAAAARDARRPTYNKPSLSVPPSDELTALAERFRNAAAEQQARQIQQQLAQDLNLSTASSVSDSFYSVTLQNTSIIDSDISEMGSIVDTAIPLTPTSYTVTKPPMPVICNMNVNNASLSTPSPPTSQPWIKDLIGSIGEISGQDSMDTSCKNDI
jgi:hypothetical protein